MHGIVGKFEKYSSQQYQVCVNRNSDGEVMAPRNEGAEQFFCVFPAKILAKPEILPANRELHVVTEVTLFLKVPDLWTNS